jgi:hypothetical protein
MFFNELKTSHLYFFRKSQELRVKRLSPESGSDCENYYYVVLLAFRQATLLLIDGQERWNDS